MCELQCLSFKSVPLIFTRIHDKWTPFVAIALQAYAELNQHKTAVGFASKVFGNPEKFPPVVLELW